MKVMETAPRDAWGKKLRAFVGAETDECTRKHGWGGSYLQAAVPAGVLSFDEAVEVVGDQGFCETFGLVLTNVSSVARERHAIQYQVSPNGVSCREAEGYVRLSDLEVVAGPQPATIELFDRLIELSRRLPTGAIDSQAMEKLAREREELAGSLAAGDPIGALLEAGDCVYYAAKAVFNGAITMQEFEAVWGDVSHQVSYPPDVVGEIALEKYRLRARPGNPKDDTAERQAANRIEACYRFR